MLGSMTGLEMIAKNLSSSVPRGEVHAIACASTHCPRVHLRHVTWVVLTLPLNRHIQARKTLADMMQLWQMDTWKVLKTRELTKAEMEPLMGCSRQGLSALDQGLFQDLPLSIKPDSRQVRVGGRMCAVVRGEGEGQGWHLPGHSSSVHLDSGCWLCQALQE